MSQLLWHEFTVHFLSTINIILSFLTCDLIFNSPNLAALFIIRYFSAQDLFLKSSTYINQFYSQRKIM